MRTKLALRVTVAVAVLGGLLGFAPLANAWGATANVSASCWRGWGSSDLSWGYDATNRTAFGGQTYNYWLKAYAILYKDNSEITRFEGSGTGYISGRRNQGGVTGGYHWKVGANAYDGSTWLNGNTCWVT